jgi:hypothetical protein
MGPISWRVSLTRVKKLARDKHCRLVSLFVSYGKIKCCEYDARGVYYETF